MIVYINIVYLVYPILRNPIRMGKIGYTNFYKKKGIYRNARGKCGKIPNKVCER